MSYIRVLGGFSNHKDNKLLVEGDIILAAMKDNSNFPDPMPPLDEVEAAYNEYVRCLIQVNWTRGRLDRAKKWESKAKLARLLDALSAYVNYVARGDLPLLYSSGFPVFSGRKKGRVPDILTGGRLSDGKFSDEVRFDFNPMGRDMTYEYIYAIWESNEESLPQVDALPWGSSHFTTRSRNNVIKPVPSRSTVFVKARAINRHGVGDWSTVVSWRVR